MSHSQRLYYIDNLKGFLILLVILGHCIQFTDMDYDHNVVFRYIYSFHMPLFMAVSGFVSYKPQQEWLTVKKRFFQLIVPFLAWAVLGCCIKGDFFDLWRKIQHPDSGLWFLWCLFFIVLLLKLCESVSKRMNIGLEKVVCGIALLLIGTMVALKFKLFGFQFIAWYFPFYCMGFFARKYQDILWKMTSRVAWPMLALFVVMAYWWMRKDPPLFLPANSPVLYNYAYKFVTATVALVALMPLFKTHINYKTLIISTMGG